MCCIGQSNNIWSDNWWRTFLFDISTFNLEVTSSYYRIWKYGIYVIIAVNCEEGTLTFSCLQFPSPVVFVRIIRVCSYDQCVGLPPVGQMIQRKFSPWETNGTCRWWYLHCGTKSIINVAKHAAGRNIARFITSQMDKRTQKGTYNKSRIITQLL